MDDESSGRGAKVAKLLPKGFTAKSRWKKQPSRESFGSGASNEDAPRGRSPHSRGPLYTDGASDRATASYTSSYANDQLEGGGDEGLDDENVTPIIEDSDLDISPTRPTVPSTHPSQIGHLTTSSPIIQAEHAPEVHNVDELANVNTDSLSRSETYLVSVSSTLSDQPSRRLSVSKTGLQPPPSIAARRSRSPGGRFKDVFKTKRNTSATPSLVSQPSTATEETDFASANPSRPSTSPPLETYDAKTAFSDLRRIKTQASNDSKRRPQTPPSDQNAPVIVNTPPTPTGSTHSGVAQETGPSAVPNVVVSPTNNTMISHRRARSGSATSLGPSKLVNITLPPLTPTPENGPPQTPGGSGFFLSMFSAAQNATNTLSNTVSTSIGLGNKPKTPIPTESQEGDGDTTEVETATGQPGKAIMGEPAVKTLGQGDLSLSHLGIQDSTAPTPQTSRFPDHVADARSRSESAPDAPPNSQPSLSTDDSSGRPRSLYESVGDRTPPTSVYEGKSGIHRSGSIRSAIGRKSRKRGSTGGTAGTNGTSTTIGAAIAAANASVAHPNAAGSVPKLTGFAVASKKRNRDFHNFFKSVPDDDYLIEDYSCALQREILAHGRLYVSEGHLCFSSNILGWVTTLVMSFDEIVSVEKRSTALVFKNGLMISTLHAKHVFASFTSRDSTYDLIVNIWKLGHPTLRSSLNGVTIEDSAGDKTEKVTHLDVPADHSGSGSEIGEAEESEDGSDDMYDEDEEGDDSIEVPNVAESNLTDTEAEKAAIRKASGAPTVSGMAEKPSTGVPVPAGIPDFPGPLTHAPTECGDIASHYERPLGDEVIPAPLGKVYNLVFGPASSNFMGRWLTGEQKCTDLQMEDKTGLTQENKSRGYSYIKPLNAAIGPRQTKCVVTESVDGIDLEKAVNVLVVTQTPDVPSGNVFSVKTKYCLSWAENNSTRVQVNCTIEWTGKSWIKGPIEKGANDGQIQYCKDLFAALKAAVSSRPAATNGAASKGKKKKGKKLQRISRESLNTAAQTTTKKVQDWGALEPLHGVVGPVLDILKPILTGNVVYGLLVGLLVASWFGFGLNPRHSVGGYGSGIGFPSHPDRLIAYEEVWRREESDLWDWLEERVGLHRMHEGHMPARKRVAEPRAVEDRLREEKMTEREVEEAIRVTEEKLQILKEAHGRRSPKILGKDDGHTRPTTRPETDR